MLADDRHSHPMAIVTRFDFVDDAPPANLEEAFHDALRHEPLLTARVENSPFRRPRWVPGEAPRLERSRAPRVADDLVQWTGPLPRLDPRSGPLLHANLVEHAEGWSIVLAIHHAASDGIGVIGFLERWLLAAEGKPGRWRRRPDDVMAALATRGRVAASWGGFARMLPKLAKGLEGVGEFMAHDVMALGGSHGQVRPERVQDSTGPWQPAIVSATLDETVVQGLEDRAKSAAVSVNDLLAMAMTVTLGDHIAASPPSRRSSRQPWLRIGIPMSLRTKNDHLLPAANRVSMVFLDRQPEDRQDRDQLATGIRDQMEIIRTHALGHIFPLSLEVGRLLPGGLRRSAERPRPQCSAVLSNVGRFFQRTPLASPDGSIRIGGGRMIGWWGVPPIRPGTALAAGTHETCGRRTVTFHIDRDRLPPDVGQELLRRMANELETLAIEGLVSSRSSERVGIA